MKRLALVLAAASLATGCTYTPPDPGSLDIRWSFTRFKLDAGGAPVAVTPAYTCATRDVLNNPLVSDVVVSFDGGTGQAVPCSDTAGDGVRLDGVSPGDHVVVVTAEQSIAGNLVGTFTATTNVTIQSNQVTSVPLPLDGIPGDLDLWGGLYTAGGTGLFTCNGSPVGSGTFTIADSFGTVIATGSATCAASPIMSGPNFVWMLGAGFSGQSALDLDTYTIRFQAATYDSLSKAISPTCLDGQAFAHATTNDTGVASWFVQLYDVSNPANVCP
jgi:hypothetical protein